MRRKTVNIMLGSLILFSGIASSFIIVKKTKKQQSRIIAKKAKIAIENLAHTASIKKSKSVLEVADSICKEAGVPFELIKEIGQNESGWQYIKNKTGGTDFGDLQVIDKTFDFWYKRLKLKGGKTRRNYLKIGIYYMKWLYDREGTWKRARFAYGRGTWRDEITWTAMEKRFMHKIDWTKYDK